MVVSDTGYIVRLSNTGSIVGLSNTTMVLSDEGYTVCMFCS